MKMYLYPVVVLISAKVFALNVTPNCNLLGTQIKNKLENNYASTQLNFYLPGLNHQFFSLSRNQCVTVRDPGAYQSTLVLKSDGNLINYVYNEQEDLTYIAFASDSSGLDVATADFSFDSDSVFGKAGLELLDNNYQLLRHVKPVETKYLDETARGSLELGGITQLANGMAPKSLSSYDKKNGKLYNYTYLSHPVNYIDLYFDNHTIETRDADYNLSIDDLANEKNPAMYNCVLPADKDCYGKVKYIALNHYIVYLEPHTNMAITKMQKNNPEQERSIYFKGTGLVFFDWNNSPEYTILLKNQKTPISQHAFKWLPYPAKSYSELHILSWEDALSLPDGAYKSVCKMDSMHFAEGILSGICSYIDDSGIHWVSSSLNYDQQCKKDTYENDQVDVSSNDGRLICQQT